VLSDGPGLSLGFARLVQRMANPLTLGIIYAEVEEGTVAMLEAARPCTIARLATHLLMRQLPAPPPPVADRSVDPAADRAWSRLLRPQSEAAAL